MALGACRTSLASSLVFQAHVRCCASQTVPAACQDSDADMGAPSVRPSPTLLATSTKRLARMWQPNPTSLRQRMHAGHRRTHLRHPQQGCCQNRISMRRVRAAYCQCRHARPTEQGSGRLFQHSAPHTQAAAHQCAPTPTPVASIPQKPPTSLEKQLCAHKDVLRSPFWSLPLRLPASARRSHTVHEITDSISCSYT